MPKLSPMKSPSAPVAAVVANEVEECEPDSSRDESETVESSEVSESSEPSNSENSETRKKRVRRTNAQIAADRARENLGWTRPKIERRLMESDNQFLTKALIAIFKEQTASEREEKETKHHNGRGFNKADAKYGTLCAKHCMDNNCTLQGPAAEAIRRMMMRYSGQLASLANARAAQVAAEQAAQAKLGG